MQIQKITEEQLQIILDKTIPDFGFLSNTLASELVIYDDYIDALEVFEEFTIAPYVSPCLDGVPVYNEAAVASRYKIPYVKLEDYISLCNILDLDYVIGGKIFKKSISAKDDLEKINLSRMKIIQKHKQAIGMLLEKQMIDFLLNGKIDTRSGLANGELIDFRRDIALQNVIFAADNKWNYVGGSVLNSLQLAKELLAAQGIILTGVIADSATMKHVHIERQKMKCCPSNTLSNAPSPFTFSGSVSTFTDENITYYEYDAIYRPLDLSTGTPRYNPAQKLIPAGTAIFIGKDGSGQVPIKKIYGKIKDIGAIKDGTAEQKIHSKLHEDKKGESIITQAAPLVWGNANCAFSAKVVLL